MESSSTTGTEVDEDLPKYMKDVEISKAQITRCYGILDLLEEKTTIQETSKNWRKFREDFKSINEKLSKLPETKIVVHGDTGAGKSSLLNALLDEPDLLPTSGLGRACTSTVIELQQHADHLKHNFEAEVKFLSAETVDEQKERLREESQYKGEDDDGAEVQRNAEKELKDHQSTENEFQGDAVETFTKSTAAELKEIMEPYIRPLDDQPQYWIGVKSLTVRHPRTILSGHGSILIDLPGVGDSNPTRNELSKKFWSQSDVLLIVVDIQRGLSSKTVEDILGDRAYNEIRRDNRLAVIAFTKSDSVSGDEVMRERDLDDTYSERIDECEKELEEIEKKLEEVTDEKKENDLLKRWKQLKKEKDKLRIDEKSYCGKARNAYVKQQWEASRKSVRDMKVFCLSPRDYTRQKFKKTPPDTFTTEEDTGIPGLRKYLKDISSEKQAKYIRNLQNDLRLKVSDLKRTIHNCLEKDWEESLKRELRRISEKLKSKFKDVTPKSISLVEDLYRQHKLQNSIEQGSRSAEEQSYFTVVQWGSPINKEDRSKGGLHHNTYVAALRRNGKFSSQKPDIGVIDMNYELVQPFWSPITEPWEKAFSRESWSVHVWVPVCKDAKDAIKECSTEIRKIVQEKTQIIQSLESDTCEKVERVSDIFETVEKRQRIISGSALDFIEKKMAPTYTECLKCRTKKPFYEARSKMEASVQRNKEEFFEGLKSSFTTQLKELQDTVKCEVDEKLEEIWSEHQKQMEPLWLKKDGDAFLGAARNAKEKADAILLEIEESKRDEPITPVTAGTGAEKRKGNPDEIEAKPALRPKKQRSST